MVSAKMLHGSMYCRAVCIVIASKVQKTDILILQWLLKFKGKRYLKSNFYEKKLMRLLKSSNFHYRQSENVEALGEIYRQTKYRNTPPPPTKKKKENRKKKERMGKRKSAQ